MNHCMSGARYELGHCDDAGGDGDGDCSAVPRTLVVSFEHASTAQIDNAGEPTQLWPIIADGWVRITMGNVVREHGRSVAVPGSAISLSGGGPPPGLDIEFEAVLNLCVRKTTANATQIGVRCVATYPGAPPVILAPAPAGEWCRALGSALANEFWSPSLHVTVPRWSDVPGAFGAPDVHWECHRIGPNDNDIEIQGATFDANQALPVYATVDVLNCESGGDGDGDCPGEDSAFVRDPFGADTPVSTGAGPGSFVTWGTGEAGDRWELHVVMDSAFDPGDFIALPLLNGFPEPYGVAPLFATLTALPGGPPGTQTEWVLAVDVPPSDSDRVEFQVESATDPGCIFLQGFGLVQDV